MKRYHKIFIKKKSKNIENTVKMGPPQRPTLLFFYICLNIFLYIYIFFNMFLYILYSLEYIY